MAAVRKDKRPVPDPAVYAPSGETWASVREHYEAGTMQKVSVARLAGIAERTLRERARKEGWAGTPVAGAGRAGSGRAEGVRRPSPLRGKGGRFVASSGGDSAPDSGPRPGTEAAAGAEGVGAEAPVTQFAPQTTASPQATASPPDPRTASGRAALVDQLYGLFAAQLAVAGGEDGLGGGLEQRMRSLATFAKTLDALVDLDKRLGNGAETEGADFDAYRAELERCLDGLLGRGGR